MLQYKTISNFCFLAYCGVYLKCFGCAETSFGWRCAHSLRQWKTPHLHRLPWPWPHSLLRRIFKKVKGNRGHLPLAKGLRLYTCIIHLLCKAAFIYSRNRVDKWNNTLHSNCMFIHWVMYLHLPYKLNDNGEFFSVTVEKNKRKNRFLFHLLTNEDVNTYPTCRRYHTNVVFFCFCCWRVRPPFVSESLFQNAYGSDI